MEILSFEGFKHVWIKDVWSRLNQQLYFITFLMLPITSFRRQVLVNARGNKISKEAPGIKKYFYRINNEWTWNAAKGWNYRSIEEISLLSILLSSVSMCSSTLVELRWHFLGRNSPVNVTFSFWADVIGKLAKTIQKCLGKKWEIASLPPWTERWGRKPCLTVFSSF